MGDSHNVTFKPGKVLDNKWIIIEHIGKGAMGEVYRAHQTNLKRDVAIKIISEDVMSEIADDPEELEIAFGRFQREVQTMAQVRHSNILTIYDYGELVEQNGDESSHVAYIVMEYIPGNSLRFSLTEDGLDDEPELYRQWVMDYFMPVLDGVEMLHNNKIVHRDLKPENIFLDGVIPKIADFGLARSQHMKAVTCSIEMLGTLAYMSPEQCADFKYADYRADIYALGKILYEAVNGTLTTKEVPFTSVCIENPQTVFLQDMSRIIEKATAEKPENRYQAIHELRSDIKQALAGESRDIKNLSSKSEITIPPGKMVTDRQIKLFGLGIVVVIILVIAVDLYDFFYKAEPSVSVAEKTYAEKAKKPIAKHVIAVTKKGKLEKTIHGKDGSTLLLTGDLQDTKEGRFLFYMDDRKITNFLFIEFLHNVESQVTVKNGIVRHKKKIVIYIGDGSAPEDSIIFEHDTFHLKNQDLGNKPVLRVTYHGAQMYANQYGKELLTDKEWLFAYRYHLVNTLLEESAKPQSWDQIENNMMFNRNPTVKTVLDGMGQPLKEWVHMTTTTADNAKETDPADKPVSGVMDAIRANKGGKPILRFPWEGFEDVGFRTKIPVIKK